MILGGLLLNEKLIGKLFGFAVGVIVLYAVYSAVYESGYQAAVREHNEQLTVITQQAIEKAGAIHQVQLTKLRLEHDAEVARLRREQVVTTQIKTVTEYVDRIVVEAECSALAADVVGVLSEATNAVAAASGGHSQASYQF